VSALDEQLPQWHQTIGPAGTEAELPVVVDAEGTVVTVKFDPAVLAD